MALRGLVAVWPRAAAGSRRAASSDGLRMAPDESGFHPDGSNEAIEIGGDWWRMLRFAKGERNTWSNFNPSRSTKDVPSAL